MPYLDEPIAYFNLFFSPGIINILTRETNAYANRMIEQKTLSNNISPHSRLNEWRNVTQEETKRFLAIMINMGLTPHKNVKDYWDTDPLHFIP